MKSLNNNSQRKNWRVVIGAEEKYFNKGFNLIESLNELANNGFSYACILHDKDHKENGELKTPHYHITLVNQKLFRLSQLLNLLADCFQCSINNISILDMPNTAVAIQYLIHKNNPEKYQYDASGIITNYSSIKFEEYMSLPFGDTSVEIDDLITTIYESGGSKIYIMKKIGVGHYNNLRRTINDIMEELGFITSNALVNKLYKDAEKEKK